MESKPMDAIDYDRFDLDSRAPIGARDIAAEHDRLHGELARFFGAIPAAAFALPQEGHWSPGDHLRHLTRVHRALSRGLRLPKLVLLARFGFTRRGSRSYGQTRDAYLTALGDGVDDNPYAPAPGPVLEPTSWQARRLEYWEEAGRELSAAIRRWSDRAMDRHLLPHPLIGRLTVREMLYFTLYHMTHHARPVRDRLSRRAAER